MRLKIEKKWHFWVLILCGVLAVSSLAIAIYYWGKLPQTIPTHFGFSGQANAWGDKSVWYSFLMPILQTLMLIGFVILYFKPQYTNMPTTMLLTTLDKKKRDYAFDLIRNMIVITLLLIGLFFTYLTYGINYSALHADAGLSPQVMFTWLIVLLAWLIWYNVKVYRVTKKFIAEAKK